MSPLADTFRWHLRRLRMMTAGEVGWRLQQRTRYEIWRRRDNWPTPEPLPLPDDGYRSPPGLPARKYAVTVDLASRMIAGSYDVLGVTFQMHPTDWSRDPHSGIAAPLAFAPMVDYREAAVVGNARTVWELNRHQHLSVAAAAYALTREERFALFVRLELESWLAQNPWLRGLNWSSGLELGLRLISWVWLSRLLRGSPEHQRLFGPDGLLWPAIYRHQWLVEALRSHGSSANNHLVGEMAGLHIAAVSWPVFPESARWARLSRHCLEQEVERQYFASGLNREQAFGYHLFTTELLLLAAVEAARYGRWFADTYLVTLDNAVEAALWLQTPGQEPNYGDNDDALACDLDGDHTARPQRLAAILNGLSELRPPPYDGDDPPLGVTLLLAGVQQAVSRDPRFDFAVCPSRTQVPIAPAGVRRAPAETPRSDSMAAVRATGFAPQARRTRSAPAFVDAGLFPMTAICPTGEVTCLADAGPLGYLSIAAHGHADALAFTFTVGDEPLIVDPGTYTYHYDPPAREYFRSTRAHNTVTVDGESQSVAAGLFMWSRQAQTTVHSWRTLANGAELLASHDGYTRFEDPVTHVRALRLDGGLLAVLDELVGQEPHDIEWRLHTASDCDVRLDAGVCSVRGRRHGVTVELDPALHWTLLVGQPTGGWFSPAFNRRVETATLVGSARIELPVKLRHALRVEA